MRDIFRICVKYLISLKYTPDLPEKIMIKFPTDSCNWSVDFFIRDYFVTGEKITEFSLNNNDRAVDFLISNNHAVDNKIFSTNINDRAVEYLISNPRKIDLENFILLNMNHKAIKYVFSRINEFSNIFDNWIFTDTLKIQCVNYITVTENKKLIKENINIVFPLVNKLLFRYSKSLSTKKSYKIRDNEENIIFKCRNITFALSYLLYVRKVFLKLKNDDIYFRKYFIDKENLKKIEERLCSDNNVL